ncbi:pre-mRNA-splicing factor CWC22 homolog [Chenopodium quinoa]|uniref:pre-mRNA-splicing factor CWC22 homolog n=1 Tax=Chenopodium quinoa TaxID=63459 RepID=UPI000B786441|nr:pre-mRNA-splicing factor CWC22 homolog [Chenopodium quinoa]
MEEERDGNTKRRDEGERNERGGSDSEYSDKERDRRRRVEEDGDRRNRKRRDNGRGGSDSESSDIERDRKRSERQERPNRRVEEDGNGNRKRRGGRERNGRGGSDSEGSDIERDRKRSEWQEREQERPRRRVEEDKDGNRKRRDGGERNGGRGGSDSEGSDKERDRKRSERQEKELPRKRSDDDGGNKKRRDISDKNGLRENHSESSGDERDRKRGETQAQEKPRKRLDNEEAGDGNRSGNRERNGRQASDSGSSDEGRDWKSSGRREKEQHNKRLDDKEDGKETVIEGRHGRRMNERNSYTGRRGNDSESSGENRRRDRERRKQKRERRSDSESSSEDRRRDRERRRRERGRRRHRYDTDDSSDSDGRRKRHSMRRSDRREGRTSKQTHDLEEGEIRSRRETNDKASELKQQGRDVIGEEPAKPQTQSTTANMNPGGDLSTLGRTGGVYIPPFKLARMMKEIEDKSSVEYQRLTWDALRKSINGLVNKVNAINIKNIIPELLGENLIRGRGLFCRSCMKSQMASPGFTDVFAALVAVVNTKFPEIGDLLLRRIILQLKRAYKRNDKPQLMAAVKFIAHLVNQQVAHELVALELLTILLEQPSDDSVEVAVDFVKECGSILQDLCPKGLHGIFERFRGILHEGEIDKRVQFLIEGLFAIRKAKFQGHPAVRPELDLVDPEDQLTHEMSLEDEIDPETGLDIFKQDPNFVENEKKYEELKKSILGDESEEGEDGSDAGSDDDEDDEEEDEDEEEQQMQIKDETETNLINLRRTIYLTIMSSVDFEEAGHKLLKIKLEPGQEMELNIMLLECCSQERTYLRYYGLLGQRFCMLNKVYQENFDKCFVQQYSMIHRLETNKLRNVAKFFAHLLGTDALPWHVLAYIRLTEEDTTSSSRIFIKILFQELSEHLGIRLLNERLNDPAMQDSFDSIFPKDNPRNTRFAINFFTSIGLGGITENLREYLKNMPRLIMQQQIPESEAKPEPESASTSDTYSSSNSSASESSSAESDSSSDASSSSSDDDSRNKRKKNDSGGGRHRKRRKGD